MPYDEDDEGGIGAPGGALDANKMTLADLAAMGIG